MLFLGDDWAEAHHDIELQDEQGRVLKRRRLPEGVTGLTQLHALIADHQALRALSNRLVGILDGCLRHRTTYDEATAWAHRQPAAA